MDNEIRVFRVGVPGPPGIGVTAEELLQIQSDIVELRNGTWRGTPKIGVETLPQPNTGASTTLVQVPGMAFVSITGLNPAVAHQIEMVGRARVTTPSNLIVSVAATLGLVGSGTADVTPNATGTFWLACAGIWIFNSGISGISAYLSYQVNSAVAVTFQEAHLEVRVTPRTD